MIPKVIHYIWFTYPEVHPETYSEDVVFCINTWKEKLPDYQIIKWCSDNFDISKAPVYVQEAYKERKYAFVSDYVRLWVLYNYGGIYLDSDVEVLRSFNDMLNQKAFTGFEDNEKIATCILASEKRNPIFKEFMSDYEGRHFILGEGQYDLTPNPFPITKRLKNHGLNQNGQYQRLEDITVYPREFFCPFNPYTPGETFFTENTVSNHHFNGTWLKVKSEAEVAYEKKISALQKYIGRKLAEKIISHLSIIKQRGLWFDIKRYVLIKQEMNKRIKGNP